MLSKASVGMVLLAALMSFPSVNSGGKTSTTEACAVIPEALRKAGELKPGTSRQMVEQTFDLDGGLQIFTKSRYAFKKCHFIKVDFEFSQDKPGNDAGLSPADRVAKASRPYLEYPIYD